MRQPDRQNILWVVWLVFTLNIGVIFYIAAPMLGGRLEGEGVLLVIALVVLWLQLKRVLFSKQAFERSRSTIDSREKLFQWYLVRTIVMLAVSEIFAICGLTHALVSNGSLVPLLFFMSALVLNMMLFPRFHQFEEQVRGKR